MEANSIKIIECFNITGLGLITQLQHFENGIPPNTQIYNVISNESWVIKKRVLSGVLLLADNTEKYFDCETECMHISHSYKTEKNLKIATQKELENRKKGIYWYLLKPNNKKQKVKPDAGAILKIL